MAEELEVEGGEATGAGQEEDAGGKEKESDRLLAEIMEKAEAGQEEEDGEDGDGEDGKGAEKKDAGAAGAGTEEDEEEKPTADDLKDLPDVGRTTPAQKAFIKERVKSRKYRERAEALEREKAGGGAAAGEGERGQARPGTAEEAGAQGTRREAKGEGIKTSQDLFTALDVRRRAQRVLDGFPEEKIESEEKAQELVRLADRVLADFDNEAVLLETLQKARRGEFGEASAEIAAAAQAQLPVVQAQARVAAAAREELTKKQVAQIKVYEGEIAAEYEKWPELKQQEKGKESPEFKFASAWLRENFGTAEKPGPLYRAGLGIPKLFDMAKTAWKAKRADALTAERGLKEKDRERRGRPLGGEGRPGGAGDGKKLESDRILAELKERARG